MITTSDDARRPAAGNTLDAYTAAAKAATENISPGGAPAGGASSSGSAAGTTATGLAASATTSGPAQQTINAAPRLLGDAGVGLGLAGAIAFLLL